MLYVLHDSVGDKIRKFIADGGQFLATYFTGYVDKDQLCYLGGFPGQDLHQVFGVISEEIDTLYPTDRNQICFKEGEKKVEVFEYQEMLRVSDAEVLAVYEGDYLAGMPAITRKKYGEGNAYYVACRTAASDLRPLYEEMFANAGIVCKSLPEEVEYHVRYGENEQYEFYLNKSNDTSVVANVQGTNILTGAEVSGELVLGDCEVAVIRK